MYASIETKEDATCSVCAGLFSDPVSLPCNHVVCRHCLRALLSSGINSKIRSQRADIFKPSRTSCPLCRAELELTEDDIELIPTNQSMNKLVQKCRSTDMFSRGKVFLEEKTRKCESQLGDLRQMEAELAGLQEDIKEKSAIDRKEVTMAYELYLKTIQEWETTELEKIEKRNTYFMSTTTTMIEGTKRNILDLETVITSSKDMLAYSNAGFVGGPVELVARIERSVQRTTKELQNQRERVSEVASSLEKTTFTPVALFQQDDIPTLTTTTGAVLHAQTLRFTKPSSDEVVIEEEGCVAWKRQGRSADWTLVQTDVSLTTGYTYWNIAITWSVPSDKSTPWWICATGVVAKDESERMGIGSDLHSWGVHLKYKHGPNTYSYEIVHNRKSKHETTAHKTPTNESGEHTIRLGFFLNVTSGTLTAIDCDKPCEIYTFRIISLSKPMVPSVQFGLGQRPQLSFRLIDDQVICGPVLAILHKYMA